MWPSSLVLIGVMVQSLFLTPTISFTSDCRVVSSFKLSLKDTTQHTTIFWGFTGSNGTFMKIKVFLKDFYYILTECSHTHVTVSDITNSGNKLLSSTEVPWPVCSGWRQFQLAVDRSNTFTITDDHNNTWVNRRLGFYTTHLEVTVDHFTSSCNTLTPTWVVRGVIPQDIVMPHCCDVLHFTLEANKSIRPQLNVGNISLPLGHLSPSQPLLSLTVKSTPGAAPRVVNAVVWGTVVEVGCALSTFSLSSFNSDDMFILLQHIHLQRCPPETHDCENGFKDGVWIYQLSLYVTIALVVVMVIVSISCFFHQKTKKRQQNVKNVNQKVTESTTNTQRESALYLEPLPAPATLQPPATALRSCWTPRTTNTQRESAVYLEPLPAPATNQPPVTALPSRTPSTTHIYGNVDDSSTDIYDEFESN